jgi:hypothetical protein
MTYTIGILFSKAVIVIVITLYCNDCNEGRRLTAHTDLTASYVLKESSLLLPWCPGRS